MNLTACPNCKAPVVANNTVCEYCNTDLSPYLRYEQPGPVAYHMPDEYIADAENAIKTIRNMNMPDWSDLILAIFWWYVALGTFGISTIFWKRKKVNFNNALYLDQEGIVESTLNKASKSTSTQDAFYKEKLIKIKRDLDFFKERAVTSRQVIKRTPVIAIASFIFLGVVAVGRQESGKEAYRNKLMQEERLKNDSLQNDTTKR